VIFNYKKLFMNQPPASTVSDKPDIVHFQEIALALSGGGFRAAAYTLGCLSYLERVVYKGQPLLQNVKYISSASGGSITALFYALEKAKGSSFQEIFESLFNFLEDSRAIESAFQKLRSDEPWKKRPRKGRNLINAFALTYDQILFKGAVMEDIVESHHSHLEEICINATEFSYGITFRFHTGSGKIGNEPVSVRKKTALQFKLGDVLAASSCFPMGFEPIMLPDDFAHKNLLATKIRNSTT
jgi:predicted acylesterase/phospholipase RssA